MKVTLQLQLLHPEQEARLRETIEAMETEADQLASLVHSLEQQRADLAEEVAALKAQRDGNDT